MALISCPDCKARVSDAAPRCLHCGPPLTPEVIAAGHRRLATFRRRLLYGNVILLFAGMAVFACIRLYGPVCRYRARRIMPEYTRVLTEFEDARRLGPDP